MHPSSNPSPASPSAMSPGLSFQPRPLSLLLAMVLATLTVLAGCSVVRTVYNQADNLVYWQLNRAFHLEDDQKDQVRRNLAAFFKWHRKSELPIYAPLLDRGAREAQGPISPELACERRDEFEKIGRRSIDHAVPMLAELLRSLKPDQIGNLQDFLDDFNEDFRDDFLQEDKAERDEAYGKFAVKWTEFFYGKFSKAQREQLVRGVVTGPLSAQDVYGEMQRVQGELVQIARRAVAEKQSQAQTEQALRTMFLHIFEPPTEARRARLATWIKAGCALASSTHNGTTAEQRNKVTEKLKDWEKDVRILATQ